MPITIYGIKNCDTMKKARAWLDTAGIDYAFLALDPDGHAVQFYYAMEQIGWDGKPRPAGKRRKVVPGEWPEALEPMSDTYMGEPFLGPWG